MQVLLGLPRSRAAHAGPVLDLGCGSGLSCRPLAAAGLPWVGFDLSPHMLAAACQVTPGAAGCLARAALGTRLPLRSGAFAAAVSVSAVQWLLPPRPGRAAELAALFESLVDCLATEQQGGAGVCLQVYPATSEEADALVVAAAAAGFDNPLLVTDFPHRTAARKLFLCLPPPAARAKQRAGVPEAGTGPRTEQQPAARCPLSFPQRCGCAASWWASRGGLTAPAGLPGGQMSARQPASVPRPRGPGQEPLTAEEAAQARLREEHRRYCSRIMRALRRAAAGVSIPSPQGGEAALLPAGPAAVPAPRWRACSLGSTASVQDIDAGADALEAAACLRAAGWEVALDGQADTRGAASASASATARAGRGCGRGRAAKGADVALQPRAAPSASAHVGACAAHSMLQLSCLEATLLVPGLAPHAAVGARGRFPTLEAQSRTGSRGAAAADLVRTLGQDLRDAGVGLPIACWLPLRSGGGAGGAADEVLVWLACPLDWEDT